GLMLGLGALLRPSNPHPGKLATYECGEPPSGPAWINFNIRFYLIALVFVIFDVELAFIYPVAAVFRDWVVTRGQGLFAFVERAMCVGVAAAGRGLPRLGGDPRTRSLRVRRAGDLRGDTRGGAGVRVAEGRSPVAEAPAAPCRAVGRRARGGVGREGTRDSCRSSTPRPRWRSPRRSTTSSTGPGNRRSGT